MSAKSLHHRTFYFSVILGLLLACSPAPNLLSTPQMELVPAKVVATIAAPQTPSLGPRSTPTTAASGGLSIQGNQFALDGRIVILEGAVVPHFIYQQIVDYPPYFMWIYRRDIDRLKAVGATFVVVPWNSGFLSTVGYVENLVTGLEYAKHKGLAVELVLHSRGRKAGSIADPVQITVADDQISADWAALLHEPLIAKRIGANVDVFGPLSEPALQFDRTSALPWSQWKSIAEKAIQIIRTGIGRPNAPIALSGVHWASDATGALSDPPLAQQVALELHPYQANGATFREQVTSLRKAGYAVFAGELGCQDTTAYTESLLDFLTDNRVSFAVYSMISDSHDPRCTMQTANGVLSPLGNLVLRYYTTQP
jgi:cellulase (glycosyl hydrolase family 5)